MKIRITADSGADTSPEILKQLKTNKIKILPIPIFLGNDEYKDTYDITPNDVYNYFEKTGNLPTTAAPNPQICREFFEEALKEDGGYDAIIHFDLPSTMSSTYANCVKGSEGMDNVFVIDSLQLAGGITIQMMYAQDLIEKGLSAKEVYQKVMARREHVVLSFLVGVISFLHKGGRCSGLAAFGANLLGIRPAIVLEKNGKMVPGKKFKGKPKDMYRAFATHMLNKWNNPDLTRAVVEKTEMDEEIFNSVFNIFGSKFNNTFTAVTGCTITSHCGKGTLGIAYYNDGGKFK